MGVSPVERESLTDKVAAAIIAVVQERKLKEGDALPPTADLAAEFDVSRTVVREALAELAGRGLVKRQQGREGVWTVPGSGEIRSVLAHRIEHENIDVSDLHEFREALEVRASALAARSADGDDVEQIESALKALQEADEEAIHGADVAFHRAVAQASHNPLFPLVLDALEPLLRESRALAWEGWRAAGGALERVDAHVAIAQAIRARDEDAAAAAMREDLAETRNALADAPRRSITPRG
jgi:GntR family transcriptional regulator, transcriptional repressor for pyruvate dehydrogenase complex